MTKLLSLCTALLMTASSAFNPVNPTLYAKEVTLVDGDGVYVLGEDTNGDLWAFEDELNLTWGDSCILILDDMGTETNWDDEIICHLEK